jgi:hypothetical protein
MIARTSAKSTLSKPGTCGSKKIAPLKEEKE